MKVLKVPKKKTLSKFLSINNLIPNIIFEMVNNIVFIVRPVRRFIQR